MAKHDPNFKPSKLDLDHATGGKDKAKDARVKDKAAKVRHLIQSAETIELDDGTVGVRIVADTARRLTNGRPSAEFINADLEAALDDVVTLGTGR